MFEKEAEEYLKKLLKRLKIKEKDLAENQPKFISWEKMNFISLNVSNVSKAFQDGAKLGYNKANEWHYVKDGDLPKDTTSLYLVRVYSWNFSFSHLYKKYTTYIPTVCEWNGEYFTALDDMAYSNTRNIKNCIAWKEIVLPKLKESE